MFVGKLACFAKLPINGFILDRAMSLTRALLPIPRACMFRAASALLAVWAGDESSSAQAGALTEALRYTAGAYAQMERVNVAAGVAFEGSEFAFGMFVFELSFLTMFVLRAKHGEQGQLLAKSSVRPPLFCRRRNALCIGTRARLIIGRQPCAAQRGAWRMAVPIGEGLVGPIAGGGRSDAADGHWCVTRLFSPFFIPGVGCYKWFREEITLSTFKWWEPTRLKFAA
jgi:hypothetical protein